MESPRERACPSCGAAAAGSQRWCLECGHELPGQRRPGLRPAIGIATTLAVLVGAASAGGYTLLQDDKHPPPPPTTVAQAPPATTPSETIPPATQEPAPYTPAPSTPSPGTTTPPSLSGGTGTGGGGSSLTSSGGVNGGSTPSSTGRSGNGSVEPDTQTTTTPTTPQRPLLALTDIALGAAAIAYAPYAPADVDLGDASRTVDGSTRTAWKAPAQADPTASPQVGVYVDLAGRETIRRLVLRTPTPGMNVEIYGAKSGPPASITDVGWDHLANRSGIAAEETIGLPARSYRYLLVWITGGPPDGARAAISELSLLSLQPE
jgi:hypothetical protein